MSGRQNLNFKTVKTDLSMGRGKLRNHLFDVITTVTRLLFPAKDFLCTGDVNGRLLSIS